jgi:putative ABC transport system permease protein
MRWLRSVLVRFTSLFHRKRRERELTEELDSHLRMHLEDNLRAGMSLAEAQRNAQMKLGGVTQTQEICRERRSLPILESLLQDIRYGVRVLSKSPGFTFVAIVTLALGISVNTAIFTAFDALVLRPRPVKDPERLAFVLRTARGENYGRVSYPDYVYYRDHSKSFSDLALFAYGMAVTSSDLPTTSPEAAPPIARALGFQLPQLLQGSAQPIICGFASGNYFPMLETVPLAGRMLQPEDDQVEAAPVVILSGNFWRRRFHSDAKIVGSVLHLNGVPFTVVGVTPLDYAATASVVPDLWAPVTTKVALGMTTPKELNDRLVGTGQPQGRLKPGVGIADAQAELNVLAAQLRAVAPEAEQDMGVRVISGENDVPMFMSDPQTWALVAAATSAVALLLLIACANVAGLLLARAVARRKEIAVRLAIGAGRWRILRQLLTESILLGLVAGGIALPLAAWMLRLLILQIAGALPSFWGTIALNTTPDIRIFLYTVLMSSAAGVVFGLTPALQASKADVNSALKDEGTALGLRVSRSRLRDLLIAGQMTACSVLLISSALLLRGSQRALSLDPGYERRHVVYLEMYNPAKLHYSQARLLQLNRDLLRRIAVLPGVQSVTQVSRGPIGGIRWAPVSPVGATPLAPGNEPPVAGYSYVTPNYFETLSISIMAGRTFTASEADGQAPVVVISEATARRFWPGENPLGKRLKIGSEKGSMSFPGESDPFVASSEVIGIAGDVRSMDLRKIDESYVYLPLSQSRQWTSMLLVRTEGSPSPLLPAVGREVRRVDANLPVIAAPLNTMVSMDAYFVISRIGGVLASIVGALGLLLACMGVYGIVSYSVAQRTREIGIRMALGARNDQVLGLMVREGLRPIVAGIIFGIAASFGVSKLLAAMLFGLSSMDAVSFLGVSALLGLIALLATWLPARRAMRVDPMVALRYE